MASRRTMRALHLPGTTAVETLPLRHGLAAVGAPDLAGAELRGVGDQVEDQIGLVDGLADAPDRGELLHLLHERVVPLLVQRAVLVVEVPRRERGDREPRRDRVHAGA